MVDRPHEGDQLLVDNADDLFAGPERLEHLLAQGLFADPFHERADHLVAHVGFQQRLLDELQPVAHVGLGELALSSERLEGSAEIILKGVEHTNSEGVTAGRT